MWRNGSKSCRSWDELAQQHGVDFVRRIVVPLVVVISFAENVQREQMHPADQFAAFAGMIDQGKSIALALDFALPSAREFDRAAGMLLKRGYAA